MYVTQLIMLILGVLVLVDSVFPLYSQVQPIYTVSTYSGSVAGYEDGLIDKAKFRYPFGLCLDSVGNIYLADSYNHCIRKITPSGTVITIAGNGQPGYVDGQGSNARFNTPSYIALGANSTLFVSDDYNQVIRKITPNGIVSTFAGSGKSGFRDGIGAEAQFHTPRGLAFDKKGNLYVADWTNKAIRKIDSTGAVTTIMGFQGGFCNGIAISKSGALYITSFFDHTIWQMDTLGKFSIFAGSGVEGRANGIGNMAQFSNPFCIVVDSQDNLYVGEEGSFLIRKITPARSVQTIAGSLFGYLDGNATIARFSAPKGVIIDKNGIVYIADYNNHRIRKITPVLRPQEPVLRVVAQTCSTYTVEVRAATQSMIESMQLIAANSHNVELEVLSTLPAETVYLVVRLKNLSNSGSFWLMATAAGNLSASLSGNFVLQPSLAVASPLEKQKFRIPTSSTMTCANLSLRNPSSSSINLHNAYTLENTVFSLPPSQFPFSFPALSTENLRICFAPPTPGEYQDTLIVPAGECGVLRVPLIATALPHHVAIDSSRCLPTDTKFGIAGANIYPMPVNDRLTVTLQLHNPESYQYPQVTYIVSNILGQTIMRGSVILTKTSTEPFMYETTIDAQTIPPGYYFLTISGTQKYRQMPFIIQR